MLLFLCAVVGSGLLLGCVALILVCAVRGLLGSVLGRGWGFHRGLGPCLVLVFQWPVLLEWL